MGPCIPFRVFATYHFVSDLRRCMYSEVKGYDVGRMPGEQASVRLATWGIAI